jgi:hypothetical protein
VLVFRLSKEVRSRAPTRRAEVKCSSEEKLPRWKYGMGGGIEEDCAFEIGDELRLKERGGGGCRRSRFIGFHRDRERNGGDGGVGGFYLLTLGEILFLIKERFGKKTPSRRLEREIWGTRDLYDSHFACPTRFRICRSGTAVTERRLEREHAHHSRASNDSCLGCVNRVRFNGRVPCQFN